MSPASKKCVARSRSRRYCFMLDEATFSCSSHWHPKKAIFAQDKMSVFKERGSVAEETLRCPVAQQWGWEDWAIDGGTVGARPCAAWWTQLGEAIYHYEPSSKPPQLESGLLAMEFNRSTLAQTDATSFKECSSGPKSALKGSGLLLGGSRHASALINSPSGCVDDTGVLGLCMSKSPRTALKTVIVHCRLAQ